MTFETALVTGGNGNLGRLVCDRLEQNGAKVIAFDLPETNGALSSETREHVFGDMRDHEKLRQIFIEHKPQAVFHLASMLSGSSELNPTAAWELNNYRLMPVGSRFECNSRY